MHMRIEELGVCVRGGELRRWKVFLFEKDGWCSKSCWIEGNAYFCNFLKRSTK